MFAIFFNPDVSADRVHNGTKLSRPRIDKSEMIMVIEAYLRTWFDVFPLGLRQPTSITDQIDQDMIKSTRVGGLHIVAIDTDLFTIAQAFALSYGCKMSDR